MGVPVTLSGRLTRAGVLIAAAAGAATVAAGCGSQVVTTSSATKSASPSTASSSGIIPGGPGAGGLGPVLEAGVGDPAGSQPGERPAPESPALRLSRRDHRAEPRASACGGRGGLRAARHAAWPDELPGRLGPQLPAQLRRGHQGFSRGDRRGRWLRRGDRGRPGALDGPLARILDRPRARHGGQQRPALRGSGPASARRPGSADAAATPQPGPAAGRPALVGSQSLTPAGRVSMTRRRRKPVLQGGASRQVCAGFPRTAG